MRIAVVDDQPGVTRDRVTHLMCHDDRFFEVVDTGGMGIADMDFRAAPCIGRALQERLKHENWGYLDMPKNYSEAIVNWNKKRYGLDSERTALDLTQFKKPLPPRTDGQTDLFA